MANWIVALIIFLKFALAKPTWKRLLLTSLNLSCAPVIIQRTREYRPDVSIQFSQNTKMEEKPALNLQQGA